MNFTVPNHIIVCNAIGWWRIYSHPPRSATGLCLRSNYSAASNTGNQALLSPFLPPRTIYFHHNTRSAECVGLQFSLIRPDGDIARRAKLLGPMVVFTTLSIRLVDVNLTIIFTGRIEILESIIY